MKEAKEVYVLTRNGEYIYSHEDINQCYFTLQRCQSQSADWAFKYEGYSVDKFNAAETFYIYNPYNFDGTIVNTMNANGFVHYMDKPTKLAEYKVIKDNPMLIAATWERFEKTLDKYLNNRETEWREVTEDRWYEMLEVLPPMRWTHFNNGSIFFLREATTYDLHMCFANKDGYYYESSKRSIHKMEDLFNEI